MPLFNDAFSKPPAAPVPAPAFAPLLDPQEVFHEDWILPADPPVSVIFI